MARCRVVPADTAKAAAERIERELRAYNKDKRIHGPEHAFHKVKPPTFEWAKNDWLVATLIKKVGKGE
jgi:putative alpha-1,2-mannosidase